MRILLVEDEAPLRETLAARLKREGYAVDTAADGEEGLFLGREVPFDLAIIDLGLPRLNGMELIEKLREENCRFPILILTARGSWQDKVEGLKTGADDYLVKPYSVGELVARIRALLRRTRPSAVGEILTHGDITLDPLEHKVSRDGAALRLGPTEFRLLAALMERPGRVWSREQILDRVWGRDAEIDFRAVDVHIGRLRKALALPGKPDPIRTVRGAGYALDLSATADAARG